MGIVIRDIERKDYKKAIAFANVGMHFDWYLDSKFMLWLYGNYFWHSELNDATQVFAAYQEEQFVGVIGPNGRGFDTHIGCAFEIGEARGCALVHRPARPCPPRSRARPLLHAAHRRKRYAAARDLQPDAGGAEQGCALVPDACIHSAS